MPVRIVGMQHHRTNYELYDYFELQHIEAVHKNVRVPPVKSADSHPRERET